MITSGERMITLKSGHRIWTKKSSQGTTPLLLVHGGPGLTHEFFAPFEEFLAPLGFQIIVYDQLDSYHSDKPNDPALWTIERFTQEIEEVRTCLKLDKVYLLGYSWGAILAMEYALQFPQNLRGLILQGFPASSSSYEAYLNELRTRLPLAAQETLTTLECKGLVGSDEWNSCIKTFFYSQYFCRLNPMPEPCKASLKHINWSVYLHFFGANDFVITGTAKDWNRWDDLHRITTPTLVMTAEYDVCSEADARKMAQIMPQATATIVPEASHIPFYENQQAYFNALNTFLKKGK